MRMSDILLRYFHSCNLQNYESPCAPDVVSIAPCVVCFSLWQTDGDAILVSISHALAAAPLASAVDGSPPPSVFLSFSSSRNCSHFFNRSFLSASDSWISNFVFPSQDSALIWRLANQRLFMASMQASAISGSLNETEMTPSGWF